MAASRMNGTPLPVRKALRLTRHATVKFPKYKIFPNRFGNFIHFTWKLYRLYPSARLSPAPLLRPGCRILSPPVSSGTQTPCRDLELAPANAAASRSWSLDGVTSQDRLIPCHYSSALIKQLVFTGV